MYACRGIALLALAALAAAAGGSDEITMKNVQALDSTVEGKIEFMDDDNFFGYAVTTMNKLIKVDLGDATNFQVAELAGYNSLYVVHEDDRYSQAEKDSYS